MPPKTESVNDIPTEESVRTQAMKDRDAARTSWFCIGYSLIWKRPISMRIKCLCEKYNLTWLCTLMSYHKFTNLGQKFNSDLTGKVMKGVFVFDLSDRKWKCHESTSMEDGWIFLQQLPEEYGSVWYIVHHLQQKLCWENSTIPTWLNLGACWRCLASHKVRKEEIWRRLVRKWRICSFRRIC